MKRCILNTIYLFLILILLELPSSTIFEALSLLLMVIFAILLLNKKTILNNYAYEYANKLFDEYIILDRKA